MWLICQALDCSLIVVWWPQFWQGFDALPHEYLQYCLGPIYVPGSVPCCLMNTLTGPQILRDWELTPEDASV